MRLPPDPTWPARLRVFVEAWRANNPTLPVSLDVQRAGWVAGTADFLRVSPADPLPPGDILDANCFAIDRADGNLSEMLREAEFRLLPIQAQIDTLWAMLAEGRRR